MFILNKKRHCRNDTASHGSHLQNSSLLLQYNEYRCVQCTMSTMRIGVALGGSSAFEQTSTCRCLLVCINIRVTEDNFLGLKLILKFCVAEVLIFLNLSYMRLFQH